MSVHKNKSNNSWYVKYKNTTKRGFKTKHEAQLYEAKIKLSERNINSDVYIYDVIEDYLKLESGRNTYSTFSKKNRAIRNTIMPNIMNKKISKVNELEVRKFRDYISSLNYSSRHKNFLLNLYKSIFNHSKIYFKNTNDPTYVLETFKRSFNEKLSDKNKDSKIWSLDEFNKFIDNVHRQQFKVLYTVLYFTGMRLGEALALTWNDFNDDYIDINKSVTKDTNKGSYEIKDTKNVFSVRKIRLGKNLVDYLLRYKESEKGVCGFRDDWFIFGRLSPLSRSTITRVKDRAVLKANVKNIRIHDFRHSHASNLIAQGVNIVAVSKRLGHSDVNITLKVYTHLLSENDDFLIEYVENSSQILLKQ